MEMIGTHDDKKEKQESKQFWKISHTMRLCTTDEKMVVKT